MNSNCKDITKCKKKIHYYSPEFCSTFTHKIITNKKGEETWIELPKPKIYVDKNNAESYPLDFENYRLYDKKTKKRFFTIFDRSIK